MERQTTGPLTLKPVVRPADPVACTPPNSTKQASRAHTQTIAKNKRGEWQKKVRAKNTEFDWVS